MKYPGSVIIIRKAITQLIMLSGTLTLSKNQSRSFVLAALMICMLSGILVMKMQSSPSVSLELKNEDLAKLPTSSTLSLRNFHRSESKGGTLIWEIKADRGEFYPEKSEANLVQPTITFFDKNGTPIYLEAPLGEILFQGQALVDATASGGAKITHSNGLIIEAPTLRYTKSSETVNSDDVTVEKKVSIRGTGFITQGEDLTFLVEAQTTVLKGNVKTVFSPSTSTDKN